MIIVRPYSSSDEEEIKALHKAQGLEYSADWNKMLVSGVVEIDGRIDMAAFLRKTAETYLVMDPNSPVRKRDRIGRLLMLHNEMIEPAKHAGFEDVHCWLPPQIDVNFGGLLMRMGWKKALWPCYSREAK